MYILILFFRNRLKYIFLYNNTISINEKERNPINFYGIHKGKTMIFSIKIVLI